MLFIICDALVAQRLDNNTSAAHKGFDAARPKSAGYVYAFDGTEVEAYAAIGSTPEACYWADVVNACPALRA